MANDPNSSKMDLMQTMLRQLRDAFLEEMPERLDHLDNLLLTMEKRGAASVEGFNDLYRSIHSIKGSGGTHGIHMLTAICHQFEDLLNSVEKHLSDVAPVFFQTAFDYIELLRTTVDQARRGQDNFAGVEKRLLELSKQSFTTEYSLLLVDGSRFSAQMYEQMLADLPIHVVVMNSGYEALLRVLNEPFDILITSQELPVLNGKALIGALRLSGSRNRAIKTILLTSNPVPEKPRMRATDPNYVLVKTPALATDLHRTVLTVIEGLR